LAHPAHGPVCLPITPYAFPPLPVPAHVPMFQISMLFLKQEKYRMVILFIAPWESI